MMTRDLRFLYLARRWCSRRTTVTLLTATCALLSISGCHRADAPTRVGAVVNQVVATDPKTTPSPVTGGLQVYNGIARQIDLHPQLKWSVVIREGNTAYVGAFPARQGPPPPDAAPRSGYRGPKLWDTPKDLAKQTPAQWIHALQEWFPPVDTYDNRPRQRSGRLHPRDQAAVRATVQQALPTVNRVLITTDIASASMLRGYADFIQSGGDMRAFMRDFHARVAVIWPHGRGVAPDRPSAAPNFGPITRSADHRTPVHGSVKR